MNKVNALVKAFKELYEIGSLPESLQKEYYLICKYETKVSERLLLRRDAIAVQAAVEFKRQFRESMLRPNPFLNLIDKNNSVGEYFPVPLIYGKKE